MLSHSEVFQDRDIVLINTVSLVYMVYNELFYVNLYANVGCYWPVEIEVGFIPSLSFYMSFLRFRSLV